VVLVPQLAPHAFTCTRRGTCRVKVPVLAWLALCSAKQRDTACTPAPVGKVRAASD
jgi:hypothetical protein